MLSFLTKKDRKRVKVEYFLRVLSIIFLMLMLLGIHSLCLIMPSYYLSSSKDKSITAYSKVVLLNAVDKVDPTVIVKELNDIILVMKPYEDIVLPSKIIENITIIDEEGVSINRFSYELGNMDVVKSKVEGIAKTRDSLLSLIKGIRKGGLFDMVDLPVSGLAKSTDIDFSINLSPRK